MHRIKSFTRCTLIIQLFFLSVINILMYSCEKFVEVDPPIYSTTGASVYNSDVTATSVLTAIYGNMSKGSFATGSSSISLMLGLSADEFKLYNGLSTDPKFYYFTNALYANSIGSTPGTEFWAPLYNSIFICNSAIEGLAVGESLTPTIKNQLIGEAKFLRAFFYFYLVNLYGDVPLILGTDFEINSITPRSPKSELYNQIILDLSEAKTLLSSDYLDGKLQKYSSNPERVRPTKWAATALLARANLFKGDYVNAEINASEVINNTSLFKLAPISETFLKNGTEAIWQLQPVNEGWNTEDARLFIIPTTGLSATNPVQLSSMLLDSFELNDKRRVIGNWVKSVSINNVVYIYPYKYKSATRNTAVTEYSSVLRLSEQLLIRSEARAQQNNIAASIDDLNLVRARAGLSAISSLDKTSLINAILHERQVELFSEWGHRWLDIKRMGKVNEVMSNITPIKGGKWDSRYELYPLPLYDIEKNASLIQNPGYF